MNKSILHDLRQKIEENRARRKEEALRQIELEYLEDIRSYERMQAIYEASGNGQNSASGNGNSHANARPASKMGPVAAVREAVKFLPDQFEVGDIERVIIEHAIFPTPLTRTAISSALNKLVGRKEIEVLRKHQGKYPGAYGVPKKSAQQTLPGVQ